MSRFVYIPKINANTCLHWSARGTSSCLRDYSGNRCSPDNSYSTEEIRRLLTSIGAQELAITPYHPYTDTRYWSDQTRLVNIMLRLVEDDGLPIQDMFRNQVNMYLDEPKKLKQCARWWVSAMSMTRNHNWLTGHFNHIDYKPFDLPKPDKGAGWQETLQSFCRGDNKDPRYIQLHGGTQLFFAAQEVSFGLGRDNNPIANQRIQSIQPDGIGQLREGDSHRKSWVALFEVKGPKDSNNNPQHALPQAFVGSTAVYAKREQMKTLFTSPGLESLRPPTKVRIRKQSRDISIILMISSVNKADRQQWQDVDWIETYSQKMLGAFDFVRDVRVYMFDHMTTDNIEGVMLKTLADQPALLIKA